MRARFTNPANGNFYDFQRNPDPQGEDELTLQRNVEHTAPTGNVGVVRQQGEEGPIILRTTGTLVHRNQHQKFLDYWMLCRTQSIYYRDFDGQEYEVLLTAYRPKRIGKLTAVSPDPTMPHHRVQYTLEMEVLRVIEGDLEGVVP